MNDRSQRAPKFLGDYPVGFRPHQLLLPLAPRSDHVTLNTGHVALHHLQGIDSASFFDIVPLLEHRCCEIPGMPGFKFGLTQADHCCQLILARRGATIIAGGLAWGAAASDSLWSWLRDYYHYAVPSIPEWLSSCPSTPPPLPWLGVVLTANIVQIPHEQSRMLGAFERDLAFAILHRSLTRN